MEEQKQEVIQRHIQIQNNQPQPANQQLNQPFRQIIVDGMHRIAPANFMEKIPNRKALHVSNLFVLNHSSLGFSRESMQTLLSPD